MLSCASACVLCTARRCKALPCSHGLQGDVLTLRALKRLGVPLNTPVRG
jgi:hypothetical protein